MENLKLLGENHCDEKSLRSRHNKSKMLVQQAEESNMQWQRRGLVSSSQVQEEVLSESMTSQQPTSCLPSQACLIQHFLVGTLFTTSGAYYDPTLPCGYVVHNQWSLLVTGLTTDSMLVLKQSANN